jgi:hypothetical protein
MRNPVAGVPARLSTAQTLLQMREGQERQEQEQRQSLAVQLQPDLVNAGACLQTAQRMLEEHAALSTSPSTSTASQQRTMEWAMASPLSEQAGSAELQRALSLYCTKMEARLRAAGVALKMHLDVTDQVKEAASTLHHATTRFLDAQNEVESHKAQVRARHSWRYSTCCPSPLASV